VFRGYDGAIDMLEPLRSSTKNDQSRTIFKWSMLVVSLALFLLLIIGKSMIEIYQSSNDDSLYKIQVTLELMAANFDSWWFFIKVVLLLILSLVNFPIQDIEDE
jgi:hypothetical protein